MKSKISALVCFTTLILASGCSLINTGPGNGGDRPSEDMTRLIQSRVKYVAAFAFTMDQVKPHKEAVCQFADQLGAFLDTYNDRDASFVELQAAVNQFISQIENPAVRDAVAIMADMVLTEAFNYAWQHYEDFINQDQAAMALIIADAVADGLHDACGMNFSTMGAKRTPEVFTTGLR